MGFFIFFDGPPGSKKCSNKAFPSGCHLNIRPQFVTEPYGCLGYDDQPFFSKQPKNAVQNGFRGNSDRHINHLYKMMGPIACRLSMVQMDRWCRVKID